MWDTGDEGDAMKEQSPYRWVIITAVISAITVAVIVLVLVDVFNKKQEALSPYAQIVEIDDSVADPKIWGINFPYQYESYLKTADQERTRYGGSEAIPHTPTEADPRSVVAQSKLEEDPRLKTIWAGYAFSIDFREERGHAHMLSDQVYTERVRVVKQPGTCVNCHASTYVAMKKLGDGDIVKGFHELNALPYGEARKLVDHPVACIDCHTPKTMKLRVTRPAFMEGIRKVKASQGMASYNVNEDASALEMRTFVCAQCHVEYYFKGNGKTLTYPWDKGLRADEILDYYEKEEFTDWTHKLTDAPVLKAQHPEFEMFSQGIHARSGVTCTDCHMPYSRQGAMKVTNHHVQSPVLSVGTSCRTCHRWTEDELKERVYTIQSRTFELRNVAMDALVDYITDLKQAKPLSPSTKDEAYRLQRRAQFFLDFVEAENSMGFHAPGEALRVLGLSIDASRKGQNLIRSHVKK